MHILSVPEIEMAELSAKVLSKVQLKGLVASSSSGGLHVGREHVRAA
jgi:hypothetical protein